jgi:hypothetical protein
LTIKPIYWNVNQTKSLMKKQVNEMSQLE